jgi:hypothetical protein
MLHYLAALELRSTGRSARPVGEVVSRKNTETNKHSRQIGGSAEQDESPESDIMEHTKDRPAYALLRHVTDGFLLMPAIRDIVSPREAHEEPRGIWSLSGSNNTLHGPI